MEVDDFDDDNIIEEDVDGRGLEEDLEQWTVETFQSRPMAGESAATMVSAGSPRVCLKSITDTRGRSGQCIPRCKNR